MAVTLRNSTAIAAFALSAAASAQSIYRAEVPVDNIWIAPPAGYVAPQRIIIPPPAEQCRILITQVAPQRTFRRANEIFLQAGPLGCRFKAGLDGNPLFTESYGLMSERGVTGFLADFTRAQRTEENLAKREARDRDRAHDHGRDRGRDRYKEHHQRPHSDGHRTARPHVASPFGHNSGGPGKRNESFDELRSRRLREAGIEPR